MNGDPVTVVSESWMYNCNGNVLTYLDPRGVLTTNTYDGANRTTSTTLTIGTAPPRWEEGWAGEENRNRWTQQHPKEKLTTNTYDGDKRTQSKTERSAAAT